MIGSLDVCFGLGQCRIAGLLSAPLCHRYGLSKVRFIQLYRETDLKTAELKPSFEVPDRLVQLS
jgi:hypothetical protein